MKEHRVAKLMSVRDLESEVRETLFYQYVFPGSSVKDLVPKYHGTYASCDGGWYAIISVSQSKMQAKMTFQSQTESP